MTIDFANSVTPRWSSDGKEIFFTSTQQGARDVYRKSSTGTGSEAPLIADSAEKHLADFSPDRKYALLQVISGDSAGPRLFVRPLASDGKMEPLGFPKGSQYWGRFSPDGRWLAYYSDVSGRREVWVAKFPIDGSRWQVTTNGGWYPRWRRDGRELFFLGFDNTVYAVPVAGIGPAFQWGAATKLFSFNPRQPFIPYDVSADGQRFIVTNIVESPDAMPITVLVNWTAAMDGSLR